MPSEMIRRALLSKGYFPRELPPVFTTEDFGWFSSDIVDRWKSDDVFKVDKNKRRNAYTYKLQSAEA